MIKFAPSKILKYANIGYILFIYLRFLYVKKVSEKLTLLRSLRYVHKGKLCNFFHFSISG